MFGINAISILLSPIHVRFRCHCFVSLSFITKKLVLYSFLVSVSAYDVMYYIICQSHKEIVSVTEGIWNVVHTFTDVCVRLPVSLCSGTTPVTGCLPLVTLFMTCHNMCLSHKENITEPLKNFLQSQMDVKSYWSIPRKYFLYACILQAIKHEKWLLCWDVVKIAYSHLVFSIYGAEIYWYICIQQSVKNYRNKYLKHSKDYRTNGHLCLRESQVFIHVRT